MKKVLIVLLPLILASLCACVPKTPEHETTESLPADIALSTSEIQSGPNDPTSSKHIDALYESFLRQSEFGKLENKYYAIYDIDGNGTEELLRGVKTTHRGIFFVLVYTIRDGKVEEQNLMAYDSAVLPNEPVLYKNGTIRIGGYDDGSYHYLYYRFEASVLKRHTWLAREVVPYVDDSYGICRDFSKGYYQEINITKEEFDRVQKEMEGDGQVVELDWRPVTDYTVTQPEE